MNRRSMLILASVAASCTVVGCTTQPKEPAHDSVSSVPPRDVTPIAQGDVFPEQEKVTMRKLPPP